LARKLLLSIVESRLTIAEFKYKNTSDLSECNKFATIACLYTVSTTF